MLFDCVGDGTAAEDVLVKRDEDGAGNDDVLDKIEPVAVEAGAVGLGVIVVMPGSSGTSTQ